MEVTGNLSGAEVFQVGFLGSPGCCGRVEEDGGYWLRFSE
jgi:hypothetical protein